MLNICPGRPYRGLLGEFCGHVNYQLKPNAMIISLKRKYYPEPDWGSSQSNTRLFLEYWYLRRDKDFFFQKKKRNMITKWENKTCISFLHKLFWSFPPWEVWGRKKKERKIELEISTAISEPVSVLCLKRFTQTRFAFQKQSFMLFENGYPTTKSPSSS